MPGKNTGDMLTNRLGIIDFYEINCYVVTVIIFVIIKGKLLSKSNLYIFISKITNL